MTGQSNTVLVTGGAGYVGSHVSKALHDAGYLPVTYDNLSRGFRWAVKWGPFEHGALSDSGTLEKTLEMYTPIGVIHLAGYAYVGESVQHPEMYRVNNIGGSQALIDVLSKSKQAKIPIVFSSTCSIYGNYGVVPLNEKSPAQPMNPYAMGKLAVEAMLARNLESSGAPYMALRYFNASGADPMGDVGEAHDPETHLIPLALEVAAGLREEITVFGTNHETEDGSCVRDYVHVSDLAEAHVRALECLLAGDAPTVVNLANGKGYSVFDVINAVRRVTGKEVRVRHGSNRGGDPAILIGDARLAKTTLNWSPRYSDLDAQVDHAWAWFKSYRGLT